mmetsp:Transcript_68324/g.121845  ORF Transcript_68324/g.121845 Transcript_68324/m.121845 type:complete len:84 (+) Transcript_68324:38-289(+)
MSSLLKVLSLLLALGSGVLMECRLIKPDEELRTTELPAFPKLVVLVLMRLCEALNAPVFLLTVIGNRDAILNHNVHRLSTVEP